GAGRRRDVPRQALRRSVLRGRAGGLLPQGLLQSGRSQGTAEEPQRVRGGSEEADEEVREGLELLRTVLPRPVLVRRDVLRLRLRRGDRALQDRQVGRL